MNKQELQNEINKTKEHLANLENMLTVGECERWKPKEGEVFYFLNGYNELCFKIFKDDVIENTLYKTYNCFQTQEQAEAEAEKILVRRMLEDIARRLNKGEKIDWNNNKRKYYIELFYNNILLDSNAFYKTQGTVFCLDENFKDVAIREIGEERLMKYLRGE